MEKTNWKKIYVSKKSILATSEKATLIKMPYGSELKDYKFWHTTKLVREGRRDDCVEVSFTDENVFNVFKEAKNADGKYEKVDEKKLSAAEMEEIFKAESNYFKFKKADKAAAE